MEDIKVNIKALELILNKTASRIAELERKNLSDWASSVEGASIISSPPTHPMPDRIYGYVRFPKPDLLLDPKSGRSWAFSGQQGGVRVVIRLGQPVLLSELRVAAGVGDECPHTALPTKLTVWDEERGSLLTTLHYRKDGSLQSQSRIMPSELPLQLVKFEFENSHDHSDFTCVGKVEIFGKSVMYE